MPHKASSEVFHSYIESQNAQVRRQGCDDLWDTNLIL